MSRPSSPDSDWEALRRQIIGLGEDSHGKNYYPALKQSRDTLVRFRGVIEEIPDLIIIVDAEGLILDLNRRAIEVLGGTRAGMFGSGVGDHLGSDYEAMRSRGTTVLRVDEHESGTIHREIEVRPVRVERLPLWVVIGRDVSRRIEVEQELRNLNQSLEDLVRERTRDIRKQMKLLTETRDQLVLSEKMAALGNLVAGIAHEINTPLGIGVTASSSQTEEVERLRRSIDNGELTRDMFDDFLEYLEDSSRLIFRNLKRAADLIRSFKLVAVDQSRDEDRELDFRAYLDEVVHSLSPQWKGHDVIVEGRLSEPVTTAPGDWSQIVTNLIVNSVRHGFGEKENGTIRIGIQEEDGNILIDYSDNGAGMTAEQIDRVFEPFYTTARGKGGTGLGMHIIYNLVTFKMGGTIEYFGPDGPGAGFRIRVPAN